MWKWVFVTSNLLRIRDETVIHIYVPMRNLFGIKIVERCAELVKVELVEVRYAEFIEALLRNLHFDNPSASSGRGSGRVSAHRSMDLMFDLIGYA
jgi:hypothetical protein